MKAILVPVAVALIWTVFAIGVTRVATRPQSANALIDAAVVKAQAEDKAVLIQFGASWCPWCKLLDAAIDSPELSRMFHDNYVILHLTVQESNDRSETENPGAQELLAEIGAGEAGIPIMLFLDKNGRRIGNSLVMPDGGNIGYPVAPEEVEAFDGLLAKTAPHMTAEQRSTVIAWLRLHPS